MTEQKGGAGHSPLDAAAADRLLDLLSSDDEFRKLFTVDRRAAFAQVGYPDPANETIQCNSVANIASKEEIAAAREELRKYLTSRIGMTNPHCFEAGKILDALRRK